MLPKVIVVENDAPAKGANINVGHISVRPENKDTLLEGLYQVCPGGVFQVMTSEEFMKWRKQSKN